MRATRPLMDRFIEKLLVMPNGCWEWTGCITKGERGGYGRISIGNRKLALAHRVAYELYVGPIPEGLTLDHLCRVRHCVNPTHLEPVTQRENCLRGESRAARHARQTHCVHGHPLSGDNLYTYPNGRRKRACLTCIRRWRREEGERRRASR